MLAPRSRDGSSGKAPWGAWAEATTSPPTTRTPARNDFNNCFLLRVFAITGSNWCVWGISMIAPEPRGVDYRWRASRYQTTDRRPAFRDLCGFDPRPADAEGARVRRHSTTIE